MESRGVSSLSMRALVVAADLITPYGLGTAACWEGLTAGRTAITQVTRFKTQAFHSGYAGIVAGLHYHGMDSLVMQMLKLLFGKTQESIPADCRLMLATTKGEIDLLEMNILGGRGDASDSTLEHLLGKIEVLSGARGGSSIISAACTSSSSAAARAASLVRSGKADCVLVVACDSVTEFIFSGFSSLMALDSVPARPFDRHRAGLNVGEAAAYALIMSEERARRENRAVLGTIAGWGMSDDANHMTGPSRESEGLILAIEKALSSAGVDADRIGVISAHGTGTIYNDQMEMRAFRSVFGPGTRPVYTVKGGIGHTMGAAGLVEMIIAMQSLREGIVPPTVNLKEADADAAGWVATEQRPVRKNSMALMTNAGFSGINTALILAP